MEHRLEQIPLQSLQPGEEGAAAAWDREIARRVDEIRCGRAAGRPAEELLVELVSQIPEDHVIREHSFGPPAGKEEW